MRFRTWVIGVVALLTLMVVVAVIYVVIGNMNPPQKNPTDGRYAAVIYKTPQCGCCRECIKYSREIRRCGGGCTCRRHMQ
jgi:hypothetical protein